MTAAESLSLALLDRAEQGRATPCQGRRRDRWTSDVREDREWAAASCRFCPLISECGDAAEETDERHGVWAGVDRTTTTRKDTTQ